MSRKWAPKEALNKTVPKMTLNEKYRMECLTVEAQLEYRVNEWTNEIPKFINSCNEKIHSIYTDQDDIDQKLTRVKVINLFFLQGEPS